MKKMIIIERSEFAQLVRNYKKALNMNAILEHACRERRCALTMTAIEVCELIHLTMDDVIKQTVRGRLRFDEVQSIRYYDVMDLINLKYRLDSQTIFRQTMDQAIPDTAIRINI